MAIAGLQTGRDDEKSHQKQTVLHGHFPQRLGERLEQCSWAPFARRLPSQCQRCPASPGCRRGALSFGVLCSERHRPLWPALQGKQRRRSGKWGAGELCPVKWGSGSWRWDTAEPLQRPKRFRRPPSGSCGRPGQAGAAEQPAAGLSPVPRCAPASSWVTLLLTQFPIWHFGYHSNLMLPFSDQIRSQLVNTALAPALVWQHGTMLHPGWHRCRRDGSRRPRGGQGAWLAPLRGSWTLPTLPCPWFPGCSGSWGCPPLWLSCPGLPSPAQPRRSLAGMWQERRLTWSKEASLQPRTAPRECFARTPNGSANLGQRKAVCPRERNQRSQAALNFGH